MSLQPPSTLDDVLTRQSGVISRRQALTAGLRPHDVRRKLRRREWTCLHPGVYIDHTGAPTWTQRAWAAVLCHWPAALSGQSAIRATRSGPADDHQPICVVIERHRGNPVDLPGIVIQHATALDTRVLWNTAPPRLRLEEAVLDVAAAAVTDIGAVAVLADAVQSRRTTASRLLTTLASRRRIARRAWLSAVLTDVASGTCSALEHGYLVRVERPHGLPQGHRQRPDRDSSGSLQRDVEYGPQMIIELDGRLFHDNARRRDADSERDLDAAADARHTIRLTWGQVFGRPCSTAAKIARVLGHHGISVQPRRCGPDCPIKP